MSAFDVSAVSPLGWVAIGAIAVVTIAWLVVSFRPPGPVRNAFAWIGTIGFYAALLSLFVHLVRRSLENDSTAGLIGFGFLATLFGLGFVVAIARGIGSLRTAGTREASATN
jgi:uncharacterized membrane protein YfcA